MASSTKITLRCSDEKEYEVDSRVVANSQTIRRLAERSSNGLDGVPIPVPNVDSESLASVSRYCYMHADGAVDEQLKSWDDEFASSFDERELFRLLLAANYLEIRGLVKLCAEALDALREDESERLDRKKRIGRLLCLLIFVGFIVIGLIVATSMMLQS